MSLIRIHRRSTPRAARDWWDKAPVVTTIISVVGVGIVSVLANTWYQRSQLNVSREAALQAEKKADADRRLQTGALTTQFVTALGNKDAAQRKLAVIAMRDSLPAKLCDEMLVVVATSDPSEAVRACAIEQLGRSDSPHAVAALGQIATNESRLEQERRNAGNAVVEVGVRQTASGARADKNLFLLGSTNGRGVAADSDDFTDAVVRGISGAADENHDAFVSGPELGRFVASNVRLTGSRGASLTPFWTARGPLLVDLAASPSTKLRSRYRKVYGLIIAPQSPEALPLQSIYRDAVKFASAFETNSGMETVTLNGQAATKRALEAAILNASHSVSGGDLFVLYYTGPAAAAPDGVVHWLLGGSGEYVTPAELNTLIERVPAKSKAVFINACYAGAMAEI